jgi:hypothetical protein
MIDQKQLENVEHFKYLGSMIKNYARYTGQINSSIAMAEAALNRMKNVFDLNLRKKTSEVLHLEHCTLRC